MSRPLRIAIIADVFPPLRSSGAVQLRDLSIEFCNQGHKPMVLIPSHTIPNHWQSETLDGVDVLRLKAPKTKDVGYIRRTIAEFLMPFAMRWSLSKSPFASQKWDGIVWYSPTIFLGPIAKFLKVRSKCKSYLIIRDIFPEWALDMGLIRRGPPYYFFKLVEKFQYSVADVIGIQTPGNIKYFSEWCNRPGHRVEVLQNWLAVPENIGCSIQLNKTKLAGRKIFVYAGNMGIAQGVDVFLDLAKKMESREDVGFVFVGRGSDAVRLSNLAKEMDLKNVLFFDEIDPDHIAGLYSQCHVGIVALDLRHKTHNIPGKFLSYMANGLPVLAKINPGNDLEELVTKNSVGKVCTQNSSEILLRNVDELLKQLQFDSEIHLRCKILSKQLFSPTVAVKQILIAIKD